MKRILMALVALLGVATVSSAQCGEELMKAALGAMGSNQYIKDFDVKLPSGSADGTKFSVVLNSRTKYQINIANGASNADNVTVMLYEGDKLIGSNSAGGKVFNAFQFLCSKTGAYKLHVYSASGSEACARAVLSLVKQYTEAEMPTAK